MLNSSFTYQNQAGCKAKKRHMAEISDQISNFMFGNKETHDLGIRPRFWLYGVFTIRKPYESGFSRTSGNTVARLISSAPLSNICRGISSISQLMLTFNSSKFAGVGR